MTESPNSLDLAVRYGLTQPSYSANETFAIIGVARDLGFRILNSGALRSSRIGNKFRIMRADLADYIHSRQAVSSTPTKPKRPVGRPRKDAPKAEGGVS